MNVYEKLVKYKKDNVVTSTDYKINVKVVSRYIALGHDTYREPPYRYCIDISPYRLIPIEKHIANQLHIYLATTGLLQKTQSGFRKHHSCQTALINIVDSWLKCIDDGNLIGSVFIDFKKAFDLVDHEILLYKLKLYHFHDLSCALFHLTYKIEAK